ncbi:hypothetical protein MYCTH_2129372 [Thermothelomyces thermophilus ATCC 42464]|uniref:HMG box domain-containing protein n=1 Tax=Thermothelomyces thermophilus (strain ATCC 42464 / BCRC 31852 / DSM 1799) TaxID=573729 RepID=G2QI94_THET4|nr:uncharacterized protein MYCTH_2129372 [Thermothelomyces thermophilus ATCC 42464]AEO60283.1 hypothetical protein MYCTH_2129372 [Thermothelomyces thermophilus ATCC 42464]
MPSTTFQDYNVDGGIAESPQRGTPSDVRFADLLQKPLSELTWFAHIPLPDIEAFVNRSRATREAETGKGRKKGHVRRPLNAFILYRKCYRERAVAFCEAHAPGTVVSHGSVSSVCGASWGMEPEHVKVRFKQWALQELRAFQKAFPKYRYQPRKVVLLGEVGGGVARTRPASASDATVSPFAQQSPPAPPPWFAGLAQQGAEYHLTQGLPFLPAEHLDDFTPQCGWAPQMPLYLNIPPAPQHHLCPMDVSYPQVELGAPVSSPETTATPKATLSVCSDPDAASAQQSPEPVLCSRCACEVAFAGAAYRRTCFVPDSPAPELPLDAVVAADDFQASSSIDTAAGNNNQFAVS